MMMMMIGMLAWQMVTMITSSRQQAAGRISKVRLCMFVTATDSAFKKWGLGKMEYEKVLNVDQQQHPATCLSKPVMTDGSVQVCRSLW